MSKTIAAPKTLLEAVNYFADKDIAHTFVTGLRWPKGVTCPRCGTGEPSFLTTRRIWKCKGCRKQFSAKVGTIFEDSPLSLSKWLPAIWMLANCKNGISSYELGRALGVTQKTAWFMLHRIRTAMEASNDGPMSGEIESDETFIGGRARFMPNERKHRVLGGRESAWHGKAVVHGLLKRDDPKGHSTVRTHVVPNIRKKALHAVLRENVEPGATLYTDQLRSYVSLRDTYVHRVVDHARTYAEGNVHVNGLENFWSLLKRGIRGTYVSIEPFHLFRYLDEQVFRFNNRKTTDGARFIQTVRRIFGKRLTYADLIGANLDPATT